MRNKLLLALLIIGVFALGILSVRAWDHYKVTERVKAEAVKVQQAHKARVEAAAEAKRADQEQAEKAKLQKACQSLNETYSKLTAYQKSITPKPNCDLQQVQ